MSIDDKDFFHEMTMRICSSLEMETAFQRALEYLIKFIPVDTIYLHLYDQSLGALRTISEVTSVGFRNPDRIITLTRQGRDTFEKPGMPNVRIVNRPETDPVIKKIAESFKTLHSSTLVLRLVIEGKRLGSLTLTTAGLDKYTPEHARLLALLNEPFAVALSNALKHQEVIKLKDMLIDDNRYLRQELLHLSIDEIVGSEFGLRDVMEMVRKVAPLDSPVLLLGETGVGKGVIASAIHSLSARNKGPFITVDSGAIPETLIDSELFGYEKGAFTGAIEQKRGRFERANHGTIFLDEIGELPPHAQIRMLRVIQEKEIERVGGSKSTAINIRIIAATHRNLSEMVKTNQFREDLWFRINVFPIIIPPLRERKEDIAALVYYFISKKARELKLPDIPELAPGAIDRLTLYNWPGNVRELENVVEREMILSKSGQLAFQTLDAQESGYARPGASGQRTLSLGEINSMHIRQILKMTRGIVHGPNGAAVMLGINPSTLRSKMKKLGIPYGRGR
jgi:transcriptional regulator with GAF, ATPase, and Fis domain